MKDKIKAILVIVLYSLLLTTVLLFSTYYKKFPFTIAILCWGIAVILFTKVNNSFSLKLEKVIFVICDIISMVGVIVCSLLGLYLDIKVYWVLLEQAYMLIFLSSLLLAFKDTLVKEVLSVYKHNKSI